MMKERVEEEGSVLSVTKLHFLSAGRCGVAASMLDTRREAQPLVSLPIWSYLIDTTDGPILIDTGMPDECVNHPDLFEAEGEETTIAPYMSEDDSIVRVLARVGYRPSDIVCLISTHSHFDHAGGNRHFKGPEVFMQQAEYDEVIPRIGEAHAFDFWSTGDLQYHLVSGDHEVAPGILLLSTPGHSVGHQSVLVQTPRSGNILLTIDAAYQAANFEDEVPFAVADPVLARSSILKLRDVAASEKAFVFYGHDTVQEQAVNLYPAAY